MDVELQKVIIRYTIVAIAISAAAIVTVYVYQDRHHQNGVPDVVGSDAGPGSSDERPTTAPSLKSMFVERNGTERVVCKQACRLEAYCSLRTNEECMRTSCDPADRELRIATKSDSAFAKADDCAIAAASPCDDACKRKAACGVVDDRCVSLCKLRAQQLPGDGYRAARCVIEAKACSDLSGC